jgi:primase-polymerase (primpol)-like protein
LEIHLNETIIHESPATGQIAAPAAVQPALWANIPAELRERPQWCIAPGTDDDKAPRTVSGANARSTDPRTWTDFETAAHAAYARGWHVGFVLTAHDPFAVIDLDVKDHTTPDQVARFVRIQQAFDSYSERSRSGRGLHIWIRANIGPGRKRDGVEIYSEARFIITTGNVYQAKLIDDRQAWANVLVTELSRGQSTTVVALVEVPPFGDDETVYFTARSFAKDADRFDALWQGHWRDLGYPSQSEADEALLSYLVHATPSNAQAAAFSGSPV